MHTCKITSHIKDHTPRQQRIIVHYCSLLQELEYGPNSALVFCMEYVLDNQEWLSDQICDNFGDDDYILFDLPGQIELYAHLDVMNRFVRFLTKQLDFNLAAVYTVDATFVTDASKFLAAQLSALTCMSNLELPHLNVLTKCDLIKESTLERVMEKSARRLLTTSTTKLCTPSSNS